MAEAPEQGNSRLSQAQAQVREVVDIMRVNFGKVQERDSKLSELDQRADNLSTTCRRQFVADNLQEGVSVEMVEAKDEEEDIMRIINDGKTEYTVAHSVDYVQTATQVLASFFLISVTLGVFMQDTKKALKYQSKARRVRKSFKIQFCQESYLLYIFRLGS